MHAHIQEGKSETLMATLRFWLKSFIFPLPYLKALNPCQIFQLFWRLHCRTRGSRRYSFQTYGFGSWGCSIHEKFPGNCGRAICCRRYAEERARSLAHFFGRQIAYSGTRGWFVAACFHLLIYIRREMEYSLWCWKQKQRSFSLL